MTEKSLLVLTRAYAEGIIAECAHLTGCVDFKKAGAPFLAKVADHLDDDPAARELAKVSASLLMRLMWLARLARPDLLGLQLVWLQRCNVGADRVMRICAGS